jgi:hypothetical protein
LPPSDGDCGCDNGTVAFGVWWGVAEKALREMLPAR